MKLINCPKCSVQYDATGYQPGMQFQCTNCHAIVVVPSQTGGLQPQQVMTMPDGANYDGLDFDPDETAAAQLPEPHSPKPGVKKKKKKAGGGGGGTAVARGGGGGGARGGAAGKAPARGGTARRAAGGAAAGGGGAGRGTTRRTAAGAAGARRGGGGAGGGGRYEPGGHDPSKQESKNLAIVVGSIFGGIALLVLVLVLANSGSDSEDLADEPGTEEEEPPPPSEFEQRRQRIAPLQNHDAVKEAAQALVSALQRQDRDRVYALVDREAFHETIRSRFGPALEDLNLTAEQFFEKYFDPTGGWGAHYARHELVADPQNVIDGEEFWYFRRQGVGAARYLATRTDGRANPYHIEMGFTLDDERPAWLLSSYNNPEYRPWDFDVDEARAQGRPDRSDRNGDDNGEPEIDPDTGEVIDRGDGRGDRTASGIERLPQQPTRNLSGWQRELIVEFLSRNMWARARQIIDERGPDPDVSAWLINNMIDEYERERPTAVIALRYCEMLSAMYRIDLEDYPEYMWLAGDNYDSRHNREVILNWRREHSRAHD